MSSYEGTILLEVLLCIILVFKMLMSNLSYQFYHPQSLFEPKVVRNQLP